MQAEGERRKNGLQKITSLLGTCECNVIKYNIEVSYFVHGKT